MPKAVAVKGTVKATAVADWTAAAVVETINPVLTVDGKPMVSQAQCLFTHPKDGTSQVKLSPNATVLKAEGDVLLHGDSATDVRGNKLEVQVSDPILLTE